MSHQSAQHEVSGKEVHAHGGDEEDEGEDDGEVLEEVAGGVADDEEEHEVLEEEEGVLQVAEQGVGLQDEETRVEAVAVKMNDLDDIWRTADTYYANNFFEADTETKLSKLSQGASCCFILGILHNM